ncbi:hypothetical protein D3C81_906980 [compost metagenome]
MLFALLRVQRFKLFQRHGECAVAGELLAQRRAGKQRQINHANTVAAQLTHPRLPEEEVEHFWRFRHQRGVTLDPGDHIVTRRSQITGVIKLQET